MKKIIFCLTALLILPFAANTLAQEDSTANIDSAEAEAVMSQYLAALAGGDVATMKTLLGGRLKAKRTPLLDNPDYAAYLVDAHANASFEIMGTLRAAPNIVSVDVVVSFKADETVHKSYTLMRDTSGNAGVPYLIISEAVMAE